MVLEIRVEPKPSDMKKLLPYAALLCSVSAGAQSQPQAQPFPSMPNKDYYTVISCGYGQLLPGRPGHDVSTSFPYTVTDLTTGVETQQTFRGSLGNVFARPINMVDLLNAEFVLKRNSIELGFGIYEDGKDNGTFFKIGYGRNLSMGAFRLRPGVAVGYMLSNDDIGIIDNRQKELSFFNYHVGDQFVVTDSYYDAASDITTSTDRTVDADHLDVGYLRGTFFAEPKLTFATKPLGRFVASLDVGWMVQLGQVSQLQFTQRGGGNGQNAGHVVLDSNGDLGGFYASLRVGWSVWPKRR